MSSKDSLGKKSIHYGTNGTPACMYVAVADPEGFHRFTLKPPLLDNVYNTLTATLDSKETSLPSFKFVY